MSNAILARSLHHAKVCFIPHPLNDHRPLALRHRSLGYVSALLIATKLVALSVLALVPTHAELSTITVNRIIQLTNAERVKHGLPALTINNKLTQAASNKAKDMLNHQYFAHISPSGITPWYWMEKAGYTYEVAGENLAIDFTEAEDVISAWLASPTHRANLLHKAYTETGVAVASGDFNGSQSIIAVHEFGRPLIAPTLIPEVAGVSKGAPVPEQIKQVIKKPATTPIPTPVPEISPVVTPVPEIKEAIQPVPEPEIPPTIVLSPAFDHEQIAVVPPAQHATWQLFNAHSSLASSADVISTIPLFTVHPASALKNQLPSTIARASKQFTGAVLVSVAFLLTLAILIRIRIQHPMLIGHASFVILLAFALLFA